jgi:uncharacterized protein YndB with AHSA1/START domain
MRPPETPIEPVRKERRLTLPADEAFRLFTVGMGRWWPLASHSIAGDHATGVRFEGRVGGRVVELTADGSEHPWADVLAWEPPCRLVLAWHPSVGLTAATILEVSFEDTPEGCRLLLQHSDWEALGAQLGAELRAGYEPGWDVVLAPYEALAR